MQRSRLVRGQWTVLGVALALGVVLVLAAVVMMDDPFRADGPETTPQTPTVGPSDTPRTPTPSETPRCTPTRDENGSIEEGFCVDGEYRVYQCWTPSANETVTEVVCN